MAFTIQNWTRLSAGANEPIVTLTSGSISGCFREYGYYTADTQVTVATASYFDDVNYDITTGDYVSVYSTTDGSRLRYRLTNTSGVITCAFVSGSAYASVAITNAELLGAYAASKLLLAAPGANRMYVLNNATLVFDYDSGVTANGGNTHIQYSDTVNGGGTGASELIANTVINGMAADSVFVFARLAGATIANANAINQGLYFANAGGAYTQALGASTATIIINADIIPTA